ncbi:MAG: histidine phosphatase family protein [Rhizobium sp.]|nr:MAG: histidine phosphatase family protein [Rhizobium sp.]
MRTLTIIRHAKSSWEQEGLHDFERPLNDRGRRDAPVMAARLRQFGAIPDLLVSSPALRAITTARIFADGLDISTESIQLQAKIYEASVGTLLQIVRELDDRYAHVALFGHNPGLSNLARKLAHCDFDELPTCGMVQISLPANHWRDVSANSGQLLYSSWPKDERAR